MMECADAAPAEGPGAVVCCPRRFTMARRSASAVADPPAAEADVKSLISNDELVDIYRKMLVARRFEERCAQSYTQAKIGGYCHLYIGQEAVGAGFLSALR